MASFELIIHTPSLQPTRPGNGGSDADDALAGDRPSSASVGHRRVSPLARVRRWVIRALRERGLPWLTYSRLGQWIVVVVVAALAMWLSYNAPALQWIPGQAFVIGFVGSGLVIAVSSRTFQTTPLGDVVGFVWDLIRLILR